MIRLIAYCLIGLFFIGCASTKTNKVSYEEYKPSKKIVYIKAPKKKEIYIDKKEKYKVKKTSLNGSIKGKIVKLTKVGKIWYYEVKSNDTSNNKLSFAKFSSRKKVAKKGDFVYVIIEADKLKEIYLIKKANYKSKMVKKTHIKKKQYKPKAYKRTKKHQSIGVPTVESIDL